MAQLCRQQAVAHVRLRCGRAIARPLIPSARLARPDLRPASVLWHSVPGARAGGVSRAFSEYRFRPRGGPPPDQEHDNPYKVLGVEQTVGADDLKNAYRKLALKWHPDRNSDNKAEAERQFKRINEAYSLLSDPEQRTMYDQFGSAASSGGMRGPGAHQQPGRPMTSEEAEAMFRSMFGNRPVADIVKEMEEALKQQEAGMQAKENALLQQVQQLRVDAYSMKAAALRERNTMRRANLLAQAAMKAMQADRLEQARQVMSWQNMAQRLQGRAAVSKLRQFDPEVQAVARRENSIRLGVAFGAAMWATFGLGYGLIKTILVYFAASFSTRVTFAILRLLR